MLLISVANKSWKMSWLYYIMIIIWTSYWDNIRNRVFKPCFSVCNEMLGLLSWSLVLHFLKKDPLFKFFHFTYEGTWYAQYIYHDLLGNLAIYFVYLCQGFGLSSIGFGQGMPSWEFGFNLSDVLKNLFSFGFSRWL